MAFPTTSTLDDFNRGSIGSGWTADPLGLSHAILEIVSNSINGGAGAVHTAAYWNATTYGADTEAGCLCPVWDTGGNFHGVSIFVRLAQVGSSSTVDGDRYNFRNDTADVNNDLVELYRINNGVETQLTNGTVSNYANGDSVGVEAIGTTLKAYRKRGGTWTEIDTHTDSSPINAAGYIGLHTTDGWSTGTCDDFFGGTIGGAAAQNVTNVGGIARPTMQVVCR
jgi:hypothetical protein